MGVAERVEVGHPGCLQRGDRGLDPTELEQDVGSLTADRTRRGGRDSRTDLERVGQVGLGLDELPAAGQVEPEVLADDRAPQVAVVRRPLQPEPRPLEQGLTGVAVALPGGERAERPELDVDVGVAGTMPVGVDLDQRFGRAGRQEELTSLRPQVARQGERRHAAGLGRHLEHRIGQLGQAFAQVGAGQAGVGHQLGTPVG